MLRENLMSIFSRVVVVAPPADPGVKSCLSALAFENSVSVAADTSKDGNNAAVEVVFAREGVNNRLIGCLDLCTMSLAWEKAVVRLRELAYKRKEGVVREEVVRGEKRL